MICSMLLQDRSVTPTRFLADRLFVALLGGRDLLLFAKHLFLAAKRWQFVPASGVRWSRVSAAKG